MTMGELFGDAASEGATRVELAPGAMLLRGLARARDGSIRRALDDITAQAPFRHMVTPGGFEMSVAMTNCGRAGWVTDRTGYRYVPDDPVSGRPWPEMPPLFLELAAEAAEAAGYPSFVPDACLVNRYVPGARLSLHQDRDERDFASPIVSVSLGLPAIFQFGGPKRSEAPRRIALEHGDVAVWGGPSRLHFHGVLPLKEGEHPLFGPTRVNLTLRKAL